LKKKENKCKIIPYIREGGSMVEQKIKKMQKKLDFYIEDRKKEDAYKAAGIIDKLIADLISESEEINFGRFTKI
jgi:hypothetical protein